MLLIETYIQVTPNRGLGLFTKEFIPKGTVWWIRSEEFDHIITQLQYAGYNTLQQKFIEQYGSFEMNGNWYVCLDDARFVNHSENPKSGNTFNKEQLLINCYFIQDIYPNEEILCDYRDCCLKSKENLGFTNLE